MVKILRSHGCLRLETIKFMMEGCIATKKKRKDCGCSISKRTIDSWRIQYRNMFRVVLWTEFLGWFRFTCSILKNYNHTERNWSASQRGIGLQFYSNYPESMRGVIDRSIKSSGYLELWDNGFPFFTYVDRKLLIYDISDISLQI